MSRSVTIRDICPTQAFDSIVEIGLKALKLALAYKAILDPKLPGTLSLLSHDLEAMNAVVPRALETRREATAAPRAPTTLRQSSAAREARTGVFLVDAAAMASFVESIRDAALTKEKRAKERLSERERDRIGNRILQSVVLIAAAGRAAFVNEPIALAGFDALRGSPKAAMPAITAKKYAETAEARVA